MFHTVTYDVVHSIIKKNFVSKTMIMGGSTKLYARILEMYVRILCLHYH